MNILLALWNLMQLYWSDILIVLIFIAIMLYLWKRGQQKFVKKVIKALVIKAEQQLGSKTGELKSHAAYNMLPGIIKMFVSYEDVKGLIKDAAKWLKQKQEENPDMNLLTYAEELNTKPIKVKTVVKKEETK